MYRVTGTWAGYTLYEFDDVEDVTSVERVVDSIESRFKEGDFSLPKCLAGVKVEVNILCITATRRDLPLGQNICLRRDVKL